MSDLPPPNVPPAVSPFPPPEQPSPGRDRRRIVLVAAGALVVILFGWLGVSALGSGDDEPSLVAVSDFDAAPATAVPPVATPPTTPTTFAEGTTGPVTTPTTTAEVLPPVPTTPALTVDTVPRSEPEPTAPSTTPSTAPSTTPSTTPATAPPDDGPTYPVLSDGSPVPIEVVFDDDVITMTGTVPSAAAIDRMTALAIANSKNPDAEIVTDLVIDVNVPLSVGVRVIELNSPRFGAGSSSLTPEHQAELDRVVALLSSLENVNVLVIGHSDQRGDPATNFALSEDRALSVVSYFVEQGIAPDRTSLRAVGEDNPLSLSEDQVALELNRRTEFIFTGLLVG